MLVRPGNFLRDGQDPCCRCARAETDMVVFQLFVFQWEACRNGKGQPGIINAGLG